MQELETVIPEGFAIFEDGPFLQFFRRSPALRRIIDSPALRALGAVAIAWLPLLVLSIRSGTTLHGAALPFFKDIQTQVRMLITLPLYIIAAHEAHRVTIPTLKLFVERGIIQANDRGKFTSILRTASIWNHSFVLRIALLGIIAVFGNVFWKDQLASRQVSAWYGGLGTSGVTLTSAGHWFVWISNPLFQYLHMLWVLRLLMYALMLARIAALKLHLVATIPDRAGGIGFLGSRIYGFRGWCSQRVRPLQASWRTVSFTKAVL